MRIIATADLHIDVHRRMSDTLDSLRQIREYGISNGADKVIVLGDVYQHRRPYSVEKFEFEKWVKSLVDNGIEVIIIPGLKGAHEFEHGVSTIAEFEALRTEGVRVLPNPSVITVNNSFRIFLGHLLLREAKMGALGYSVGDDAVSVKDLVGRYPDVRLMLLGHIHKAQQVLKNPPVLYAGSIDRITFGEKDEVKGFIDINIDRTLKYNFIPLNTRKMVSVRIDRRWLELGKPPFEVDDCIVEATVNCKRGEMNLFNDDEIRRSLKGANIIKDIGFEIENTEAIRNDKINSRATPLNAFIEYGRQEKLSEEIIDLGKAIIEEQK